MRSSASAKPKTLALLFMMLDCIACLIYGFLSSLGLWAATLPDLSLFTMNCGLSFEAATLCPLICVGLVCFLTTLPVLCPPDESHDTLSPALYDLVMACSFLPSRAQPFFDAVRPLDLLGSPRQWHS